MAIKRIVKYLKPTKGNYYGRCTTCGRYDDDGGPLCNNVFCPGGN